MEMLKKIRNKNYSRFITSGITLIFIAVLSYVVVESFISAINLYIESGLVGYKLANTIFLDLLLAILFTIAFTLLYCLFAAIIYLLPGQLVLFGFVPVMSLGLMAILGTSSILLVLILTALFESIILLGSYLYDRYYDTETSMWFWFVRVNSFCGCWFLYGILIYAPVWVFMNIGVGQQPIWNLSLILFSLNTILGLFLWIFIKRFVDEDFYNEYKADDDIHIATLWYFGPVVAAPVLFYIFLLGVIFNFEDD